METMPFPFLNLISSALLLTLYIGIPLLIGFAIFMIARNTKTSNQVLEEILNQQKETNQMMQQLVSGKSQSD
jgi:ACR3 family arsenite efflux pump ArsB